MNYSIIESKTQAKKEIQNIGLIQGRIEGGGK